MLACFQPGSKIAFKTVTKRIRNGYNLEAHRETSRERVSIIEYQQMINWLSEEIPSRGSLTEMLRDARTSPLLRHRHRSGRDDS